MCCECGFADTVESCAWSMAVGHQEGPGFPGEAGAASVLVDCCNTAHFAYKRLSSLLLLSKEYFSRRHALFVLSF